MRLNLIILIAFSISQFNCLGQGIIEIPLFQKEGFGHFYSSISRVSYLQEDEDNPWIKTYLKAKNVPESWTEVKYGAVETDIYQSTYQNYILGKISAEWYENLQKSWKWPDTSLLSKQPIKTKIAFASGKDSTGQLKLIIDANNNHDFSDDIGFTPLVIDPEEASKIDSFFVSYTFNVSYEKFIDNKIIKVTAPMFICYVKGINAFMANFPQYSVGDFMGETIAVCSGSFSDLSYRNPNIVLIHDSLKPGDKVSSGDLIEKDEFIKIKGSYYRNIGVNTVNNTLILEKKNLSKKETYSPQVGFKSFDFEGKNFITKSKILSEELRGKYILLDFWAVWCSPCLQEIPDLKKLYDITDREKFDIIGIVAESSLEVLAEIINNKSVTWPQILSTDANNIKKTYGVEGFPTTFLIDPEGTIIAKDLRGKELEKKVLEILRD
jgi:thiol-disulfide isomerase/thioredoxin